MPVAGERTRGSVPGQGGRARITVRPGARSMRGRTPFAVLVVALLSAGLLGLLMLNTALNEGSFTLARLKKQTTEATDRQQTLQQQIAEQSAPDALEQRARALGMVPGGDPAFLNPDGTVTGTAKPAQDKPPVPRPSSADPSASASASGSGAPAAEPTADPTASGSASGSAQPGAGASPADPGIDLAPAPPASPSAGAQR
ncbi:septum formation initiator family protein [Kitasatospora saccharophila]|uniref:Septum formation initiator family protein n=2 Tax=Kitasatospora saccharophila TaxID=407973 RepID=A0ABP5J0A0_9ACTN